MEISPIREIRAVGAASTPKGEAEVQPTFALSSGGRLTDDAYRGNGRGSERGLEEGEPEESEDQMAKQSDESDPEPDVNFFA